MTGSRDFKRLVRKRMAETGESYTVARSHFDAPPKELSTVAAFKKDVYGRRRTKDLAKHLERHYDIRVSQMTELDVGVYRIDRGQDPSWVARIFPAVRSIDAVRGDAQILTLVEQAGLSAERVAHADPVSVLAGQPVLVTEFVQGMNRRSTAGETTMRYLGGLVGALHALPDDLGPLARPAGSWHHLSINGGGRHSDIETLSMLLSSEAGEDDAMHELREQVEALDDLEDLPKALIHPDPCGANLISWDDDEGVLIDWTGAGIGPRIISLANLLSSVTVLSHVDAAIAAYRERSSLDPEELDRFESALIGFPLMLDVWMVLFRGAPAREAMQRSETHRQRAAAIAERARAAFAAPPPVVQKLESADQPSLF